MNRRGKLPIQSLEYFGLPMERLLLRKSGGFCGVCIRRLAAPKMMERERTPCKENEYERDGVAVVVNLEGSSDRPFACAVPFSTVQ